MAGEVHVEAIVTRAPLPPTVVIALITSMIEAYTEQDLRPSQLRGLRATLVADRVAWIAGEVGPGNETAEYALGKLMYRMLTGRPLTPDARVRGGGVAGEDAAKLLSTLLAHPPDLSGCRRFGMEARRRSPLDLGAWLKAQFPSLAPGAADLEAWTGVYPTGRLAELLQQRAGQATPVDPPEAPIDGLLAQLRGASTPVPVSTPLIVAERLRRPATALSITATALLVVLTAALTALAVGLAVVLFGGRP